MEEYDLVLADPPYTNEDHDKYGTTPIKRNVVLKVLGERLKPGAFVVWLDMVLPIFRKDQFSLVGCIGMYKSTNHRIRGVTIFHKNILTEKHKCVILSSPTARTAGTTDNNMNTKQLALVAGILATAFTQIKNVFSGEEATDPAPPKNKKPVKDGKTDTGTYNATETEDEKEDDDDLGEDDDDTAEDKVDYEALRKECRRLMKRLVDLSEDNKAKIRAVLKKLGEVNLGDAKKENLADIKAAFQKLLKA